MRCSGAMTLATAGAVLVGMVFTAPAGAAASASTSAGASAGVATIFVAVRPGTPPTGRSCKTAKYSNINSAIKAAPAGAVVVVCEGTYTSAVSFATKQGVNGTTGVWVNKPVTVAGEHAVINAAGLDNAVTVTASGAAVRGLTATGALGEGILVAGATRVTIEHNTVTRDDTGGPHSSWPECQPAGTIPGDCGEGIHLMSVTRSVVGGNTVTFNAGGILLSDEFGPTSHDLVAANLVEDNESDCGITVVGHNGGAVNGGKPQPAVAGVFANTISGNVVISNGTAGDGGGILFGAAVPGAGSYDNTVTGNEIAGNGLSGVTIHQHIPGQDLSGDVISRNWIATNNILGDPGTGDSATTGVLLDNGGTHQPIEVTIMGNTILRDHYGIFDDTGGGLSAVGNHFIHVIVRVKT